MKKITIQKCTLKDANCILKIFNESVNKGITETKTKIQFDDHIKWLKKKLFSKKDIIYVGKINKITVGYIRFDNIDHNKCEISIAFKKQYINKGFGSILLKNSIKKLIKLKKIRKITSKVRKKNINSINFFLKNNFLEIKNKKRDKGNYKYFILNLK
tara:strand:- start:236 stop:706 length:471 start_codon:yes stop_codon:yes gene_type:complete